MCILQNGLISFLVGFFAYLPAQLFSEESSVVEMAQKDPTASLNDQVSFGYEQMEKGDSEGALSTFQSALLKDSADLPAMLGRAMIHAERRNYPEAFSAMIRLFVCIHSMPLPGIVEVWLHLIWKISIWL